MTQTDVLAHDEAGAGPPTDGTDAVAMELVRLRKSMESFRALVLDAGGHGLEGSSLAVLFHLTTAGAMRTSNLSERLGLDPSTTSRHVASLERTGHVERVPDPEDGRAQLIRATDAGSAAFSDTRELRNRLIATVLADWGDAEIEAFAASLSRFNHAVDDLDVASFGLVVSTSPREDHR